MSGPESPDAPTGPPVEPAAEVVEPGHRARALAASLLGELTGQRRSSLSFSPQEPSGLASVPRHESTPPEPRQESPADARAEQPEGADSAGPVASTALSSSGVAAATAAVTTEPAARARHADEQPVAERPPAQQPERPPAQHQPERPPAPPQPEGLAAGPSSTSPGGRSAAERPGDRPSERTAAARTADERPAEPTPTAAGVAPRPTGALPQDPATARAPVRTGSGQAQGSQDVRPAPFAYLAVAQHHTGPARATANGALDQAGQRISSRVERALVRRAALVTTEAASLLDACDLLDERARAVDATWTGERHSATEVREFEGAWGGFYDAQGALAQHVTG